MDEVKVERTSMTQLAKFEKFNINEYRNELFSMYAGERERITLLFPEICCPMLLSDLEKESSQAA